MQYELVFLDRGNLKNSVRMYQTIQKVKALYPEIEVVDMMYQRDNPYGIRLETRETCMAVLLRNQKVICHIKGDTPFCFFKLWLEEKILQDGGVI